MDSVIGKGAPPMDRNIQNAPGFWELMQWLATLQQPSDQGKWHTFSIKIRTEGDAVWVSDAYSAPMLPGTEPREPSLSRDSVTGDLFRHD